MSSSIPENNIKVKSEIQVLGKTKVDWEIVGWSGTLSHIIRSKAYCFVNVPVDNNPASDIKLRFHLKPHQSEEELLERYCSQGNNYADRSSQFFPQTPNQSTEYSLLVDVLSPQEDVLIKVSVQKHDEFQQTVLANNLDVDVFTARENLVVVPDLGFVNKSGNTGNCGSIFSEAFDNATFHLTITAYELTTMADVVKVTKNEYNENGIQDDKESVVKSGCPNGQKIHSLFAITSLLAEKNAVLLRHFTRKSKEIFRSVDYDMLEAICFYLVIVACLFGAYNAVEMNRPSTKLHGNPKCMSQKEPKLIAGCSSEVIDDFGRVAEKYNLTNLKHYIQRLGALESDNTGKKTAAVANSNLYLSAPAVLWEALKLANSSSQTPDMSKNSIVVEENKVSDPNSKVLSKPLETRKAQVIEMLEIDIKNLTEQLNSQKDATLFCFFTLISFAFVLPIFFTVAKHNLITKY